MSEWIDFSIYALQSVLIFVLLAPGSVRFTGPAISDRDPAWAAAHPGVMQALACSRWFVNTCYAWAAFSIAILLALRFGAHVPVLSAAREAPEWEVLRAWHSALMVSGMLGYFACFLIWLRWLRENVPLAAQRTASLLPRTAGDHVPRVWRIATEVVTVGHLATWLVAPALGFGGGADYWGKFAFIAVASLLMAAMSWLMPQRRQGYADRLFGDAYRRRELRVLYILRLAPLTTGAVGIGGAVLQLDLARVMHLLVMLIICGAAFTFVSLRPIAPGGSPRNGDAPFAPARRSAA